ncbi:hypothetical protein [Yersinia phage fHe-Yen9-04]|uniref:Uncharacterized protein n=2 Tax=Eneladusvirus Yen904 TaxID=2560849 RepID=A0A2C9CX51_9CAUD|nr:hypothetical protein FDJ41_gp039 [Yersinia phage fHe-Yen9-04]SOK58316.1 hypothetical protein [Yersinia phage fHe-Yen9-04]SOK58854.1 hypothetical protein [Yersinia phage fHe-Yen9-03]VUE36085.1 hypothetical protein [Yersinia phage fHe-Yen9-04]
MAKSKNKNIPVVNNFVAKHMETFNKPKTFVDQKKEFKNGKTKHKGRYDASFDV